MSQLAIIQEYSYCMTWMAIPMLFAIEFFYQCLFIHLGTVPSSLIFILFLCFHTIWIFHNLFLYFSFDTYNRPCSPPPLLNHLCSDAIVIKAKGQICSFIPTFYFAHILKIESHTSSWWRWTAICCTVPNGQKLCSKKKLMVMIYGSKEVVFIET